MGVVRAVGVAGYGLYAHAVCQLDYDGAGIGHHAAVRPIVLC